MQESRSAHFLRCVRIHTEKEGKTMKKKKLTAIFLTILLIVTMLPSSVFAGSEKEALGGTVKITGDAVEGGTLKADLSAVTPEDIEEKDLEFRWLKKTDDDKEDSGEKAAEEKKEEKDSDKTQKEEEKPLGEEATLKVTKEMVGSSVVLEISAKEKDGALGDAKLLSAAVTITEKKETPAAPDPSGAAETPAPTPAETPAETPAPTPTETPEPAAVKPPVIQTESLPDAVQMEDYQAKLEAEGESVTWSLKEGSVLPNGLTLNADGTITGQPMADADTYTFTAAAANEGGTTEKKFSITVKAKEVYGLAAEPASLDFGTAETGYSGIGAKEIRLVNTGNQDLTLAEPVSENFRIEGFAETLAAGVEQKLTVAPADGLEAGKYQEDLKFASADGKAAAQVSAVFEVTEKEEEKVYRIEVMPAVCDFGAKETGYTTLPETLEVTVANAGNQDVTLKQPAAKNFQVTQPTAAALAPGEEAKFSVVPKKGLAVGEYEETIQIYTDTEAKAEVTVMFQVTEPEKPVLKVLSVTPPSDITGLTNGTEKTVSGLKLPDTVEIRTKDGAMDAKVDWDVASCAYDPSSVEAQSFTVRGAVTLPGEVQNPDNISLAVQVQVSVKAYVPRIPDTSELKINDLGSGTTYKTNTEIRFSATGAGNNSSPRKGDVRYIPAQWRLGGDSYRDFKDSSYSTVFKVSNAGTYTLSVSFRRDVYNGSEWKADGTLAYKEMDLKFVKDTVTLTPAAKNTTQKKAVETGDRTNTGIWTAALLTAAGAGIVLAGLRRKPRGQK